MSWTPLCDRIDRLPLILAGPILRRTEPDAVTVWLALKEPRKVTLRVYSTVAGKGETVNQMVLLGSRYTVPLGQYLHVVAVTAKPDPVHARSFWGLRDLRLQPGEIYAYDLDFGNCNLTEALTLGGFFPRVTISYFEHNLPTFAMPPDDLNDLRIVHGSCRKPHGGGRDALPILDDLISYYADRANSRPHQLFLTGDQIYGDDVADPLLWAVTDAGNTLLGWEENLPFQKLENGEYGYKKPSELKPGKRSDIARNYGGFTAMLVNKQEKAKSHLFSLGEYYAMYLFVWSPILWPNRFPTGIKVRKDPKNAKSWDEEAEVLLEFASDLWKVRRSLANVPTYMICDDHDISDDWYLNREWCNRVLSKPFGRRVLQNGLLAYALFQGWGNTPEQFQNRQSGEKLLEFASKWSLSGGTDDLAWGNIAKCLGIPQSESESFRFKEDENILILNRDNPDGIQALNWHYSVRSFKHEVIVLDTRTWRGYRKGEDTTDPPMLLSPTAFEKQIQRSLKETSNSNIEATFVVIPTNLVSLSFIDIVQRWDLERNNVFNSDVGDSWNFNRVAFAKLLANLFKQRDRIIVLTGDIHYACAVRLNYCFRRNFGDTEHNPDAKGSPKVLAQLTSSAFKNAELTTQLIHTRISSIAPQLPQDWAGWNERPELVEIQRIQETVRIVDAEIPPEMPVLKQVNSGYGNDKIAGKIAAKNSKFLPDWWYHVEWIERQKAKEVPWEKGRVHSAYSDEKNRRDMGFFLLRNRWLQEGKEVVGYANIALVSLKWHNNEDEKAVIQDVFWRPAWKPNSVVCSRYFVPLQLENVPSPIEVIPS